MGWESDQRRGSNNNNIFTRLVVFVVLVAMGLLSTSGEDESAWVC